MSIQKLLILSTILLITAACSSEESEPNKVESDAGALQGYKDNLDKAKSVDQSMMQADKVRKEMIEESN
jgi:hypothetical protein